MSENKVKAVRELMNEAVMPQAVQLMNVLTVRPLIGDVLFPCLGRGSSIVPV